MENKKRKVGRPAGSTSVKSAEITKKNKSLVLKSLQKNLGILAPALRDISTARQTFNKWYNEDPEFRQEVDNIREEAIDFVEAQLFNQIKDGGAAQTIFYLKTKGKKRGYIEQTDTNMTIDAIKIKYIVPDNALDEHNIVPDNALEEHNNIVLPLDNNVIKLNLPDGNK